jgi:two-component system cell cycle response regulator
MIEDGNEERLAKALELGVNDYLVRPIDNDELVARTRTQVNRKRYEERLRSNYQESMNAAVTDSLTGLYNRRYLEAHFDKVCVPLIGSAKSVSALMLDIDNFKQVNDTHGHDAGDEVLREIGIRIQNNLRGSDTAVRYGGEEFVVLMPEAPLSVAISVAERLCQSVAAMPFKVSSLADGLPITVSIGVATGVAGVIKLDAMLKSADEALYRAKHEGKNRVVAADDPDPADAVGSLGAVEAEKTRPDTATRAVG